MAHYVLTVNGHDFIVQCKPATQCQPERWRITGLNVCSPPCLSFATAWRWMDAHVGESLRAA